MILCEYDLDGMQNVIIDGDFYMIEIMLLLEAVGKRLEREDGVDWRVHILNMAEVVANPDITIDEINDIIVHTSNGKRWRPKS